MILPELKSCLFFLGVKLSVRLHIDAPAGVLTPEIKAALAHHRPVLLSWLLAMEPSRDPHDANLSDLSHKQWLSRPDEMADWPIPWREKWRRRANELRDQGCPWPVDEWQAYHETKAAMKAAGDAS
jgi:hypothetical protein